MLAMLQNPTKLLRNCNCQVTPDETGTLVVESCQTKIQLLRFNVIFVQGSKTYISYLRMVTYAFACLQRAADADCLQWSAMLPSFLAIISLICFWKFCAIVGTGVHGFDRRVAFIPIQSWTKVTCGSEPKKNSHCCLQTWEGVIAKDHFPFAWNSLYKKDYC